MARQKLHNLSFTVAGFNKERPTSKGSKRKFDLGMVTMDKSRRGAWTNINDEDSEISANINALIGELGSEGNSLEPPEQDLKHIPQEEEKVLPETGKHEE